MDDRRRRLRVDYYYLAVAIGLLVVLMVAGDKREAAWASLTLVALGVTLAVLQRVRHRNGFRQEWHYRMLQAVATFSLFLFYLSVSPASRVRSVGIRVLLSAAISGMLVVSDHTYERRRASEAAIADGGIL